MCFGDKFFWKNIRKMFGKKPPCFNRLNDKFYNDEINAIFLDYKLKSLTLNLI